MTSVTLKLWLRSPGSNLVFAMSWCSCVPNFVRMHQIFLQILSGNHFSHVIALNDLGYLENEVEVTRFELGHTVFILPWCFCVPNLVTIFPSNICSDMEYKPSFICCQLKWPLWPWKYGQGHRIRSWSCPVLLCAKFGEDTSTISPDTEQKLTCKCPPACTTR